MRAVPCARAFTRPRSTSTTSRTSRPAVYTATDADSLAVSIDVEQINAKKVVVPRRTIVSGTLPDTEEEV